MEIESRYSRSFFSDRLSDTKYREIYDLALSLNKIKNEVSQKVNSDLLHYLGMSSFDFQKEINPLIRDRVKSHFTKYLMDDVYTAYQNKFESIQKKLEFKQIYDYQFVFYQRNTKDHQKGDLKEISKRRKSTSLSITLTYLARYGNEDTFQRILERFVIEKNLEKERFYSMILDTIEKFGFGRLMSLAMRKRNRIISRYSKHPVHFESLTFSGRTRLDSEVVSYNERYNSCIKAFINLSWGINKRRKLVIPAKYSKDFHGDMKKYRNGTDTSYIICFDEGNQIRVILQYKGTREIPEGKTGFVGIDVNSKHNLLQCSNGDSVDFDRDLVKVLSDELKKIDNLKKNQEYRIGRRKAQKVRHLERELKSKTRERVSSLCKRLNSDGLDHAVFENLDGFSEKCRFHDENGLNYNRKIRLLHLSSLKDEFERIARKYGICVSLVHSCYTSQTCPICGCIDSRNRKTQEEFECVKCGHIDNADLNASKNILKRVVSTVLRNELLKKSKLDNGTYEPKSLDRDEVKKILLSFRYSPEFLSNHVIQDEEAV